jgi:hypothetical protein
MNEVFVVARNGGQGWRLSATAGLSLTAACRRHTDLCRGHELFRGRPLIFVSGVGSLPYGTTCGAAVPHAHAGRRCIRPKVDPVQLVPQPACHRAGLEADANCARRASRMTFASAAGSERALPSNTIRPESSITHTAVSFCDTSNPTYCCMAALFVAHYP